MKPTIFVRDDTGRHAWEETNHDAQITYQDGKLYIQAEESTIRKIELVWSCQITPEDLILGDAWERGYGELSWHKPKNGEILPWYFLAQTGEENQCFGVKTQPNAMCYWQILPDSVMLTADISCGNAPVRLGGRRLLVCEVVMAVIPEDSFAAAQKFCTMLCPNPRLPQQPIFGGNDWYCNYGHNSYEKIIEHTKRIVSCSPAGRKPYMVVDDGWQLCHHQKGGEAVFFNGGPWKYCNREFGDMKRLAEEITVLGAIPGIWFRPLWTVEQFPDEYCLKYNGIKYTLDPSVPEVLDIVREDVTCLRNWGYKLIKHDFSSFDVFERWGGDAEHYLSTQAQFHDRSRTTAEIIKDFYAAIREAAGDGVLIISCNTLSHLSAGFFELQRTGDDTSGVEWSRTRKMGINTLAFRMPQHRAFYLCDADCVGITKQIPWRLNRQWLDVLSKSGTPLFVSIARDAFTPEVEANVREAFARASIPADPAQPLDWMETDTPTRWQSAWGTTEYDWNE